MLPAPPTEASRRWCFTIEDPTPDHVVALKSLKTHYLVFGRTNSPSSPTLMKGFMMFVNNRSRVVLSKQVPDAVYKVAQSTSQQEADNCKAQCNVEEYGTLHRESSHLDKVTLLIKQGKTLEEVAQTYPETYIKHYRGIRDLRTMLQSTRLNPIATNKSRRLSVDS